MTGATNTVSAVTLTTDRPAPQMAGTPVTFTAQPTGGVTPYQYKWIVSDGSTATVAATWNTSNRFTWTPTTANANFRIEVWVRSASSTADAAEASVAAPFAIEAAAAATTPVSSVAVVADKAAPQVTNTTITFTATPAGGTTPALYKWAVWEGSTWTTVGGWTSSQKFTWTPDLANSNYRIRVWVKAGVNTADQAEASVEQGFAITAPAPPARAPVSSVTLVADKAAPEVTNTTITFTATPAGGTAPALYKWAVWEGSTWTTVGGWTSSQKFSWMPDLANPNYRIRVWAKASTNTADLAEASAEQGFAITAPAPPARAPVSSVALVADKAAPQVTNTTITFTATPSGGTAPALYKWFVSDGSTWKKVGGWTSSQRFTWTPGVATANHRIRVWVKNSVNKANQPEASGEQAFAITAANGKDKDKGKRKG